MLYVAVVAGVALIALVVLAVMMASPGTPGTPGTPGGTASQNSFNAKEPDPPLPPGATWSVPISSVTAARKTGYGANGVFLGDISACYRPDKQVQPINPTVRLPMRGYGQPDGEEMLCRCKHLEGGTGKTKEEVRAKIRKHWDCYETYQDKQTDDTAPALIGMHYDEAVRVVRQRHKLKNPIAIFKHGGSQTVNFDPYYIYLFVDGGGVVRDGLSYLAVGYVVKHGGLIKIV